MGMELLQSEYLSAALTASFRNPLLVSGAESAFSAMRAGIWGRERLCYFFNLHTSLHFFSF